MGAVGLLDGVEVGAVGLNEGETDGVFVGGSEIVGALEGVPVGAVG